MSEYWQNKAKAKDNVFKKTNEHLNIPTGGQKNMNLSSICSDVPLFFQKQSTVAFELDDCGDFWCSTHTYTV